MIRLKNLNGKEKGMRFVFDVNYSEEELTFIKKHNCTILSEIKLSKTNFSEREIPQKMFCYNGIYVGKILDTETNNFCWAILSKWKGVYRFRSYYETLEALEEGL